jgi:serine/threonine protein kinase
MCAENRSLGVADSEHASQKDSGASLAVSSAAASYQGNYAAGDVIAGKYKLTRLLGRGGMGVVWEAYSQVLEIRVAVKLIQQFTTTSEMHQRLLLEAKSAARLVDPGVIRIFDCGQTPRGEPYIVMELLEGEDLATRLEKRGRLQPIEAVRTLLPIIRALGAAHAANIVHRDVKPENVFFTKSLTGEEQPKLFDFGIAKVDVSWEKRLTQAGSTLGSPSYMSPEQAQADEVDRRSDIWGICVVLYEVITGRLPFDGANYRAIVHAILSADVKTFAELSIDEPDLWSIIDKGLEHDRTLRWQTSDDLAEALGAWLIERGVMHDVTGVSLHATRTKSRVNQFRMLETARPPSQPSEKLRSSRDVQASTVQRASLHGIWLRQSRSRRYFFIMSMFVVCGAVLGWGIKRALRTPPPVAPSPPALIQQPEVQRAAVVSNATSPLAAQPPAPSPALASSTPQAAPSSSPDSQASPSAGRAKRAKPKPPSSKSEPFKSPFE